MTAIRTSARVRAGAVATLALLLISHAPPTAGHEADPEKTTPEVADPGPRPIAIPAIAMEAAALENHLKGLASTLDPTTEQSAISDELDDAVKHVHQQIGRLDGQLAAAHTHSDLEAIEAVWRVSRQDLQAWQKTLRDRLDGLDDLANELVDRKGVWEETAKVAADESAPAEVRKQIASASASIKKFQRRLRSSRDAALALQKRVVELSASVATQLSRIEAAQEEVLTRLTVRDAAPLWALEIGDIEERRKAARASIETSRKGLGRYVDRDGHLLVVHVLVVFALTWVCVRARRLSLDHAASSGSEAVPPALRHPWAAGPVLGLSAGIWIHESGPPEILQILGVGALPFWLIVVRDLLPRSLHRPAMALALLIFVENIRRTTQDFTELSRVLLVVEIGALAAGLIWLRRPKRLTEALALSDRFWVRILGAWLRIAMVGALLALAAVVAGWVNFGELVGSAIIRGSYGGSLLLTGARLLEDIAESFTKTGRLDGVRVIRHDRGAFVRVVRHVTRAIAFVTWILLLLDFLSIQGPALSAIGDLLATPLGYGTVNVTLGGMLAFGATLYISWLLSRFVALTLDQAVFTRVSLPRGVPFALTTITRYMILVVGFVIAVATLGFEIGNLALIISALGVGIGFGMQNVVNNFMSGLILLFERPIKVGDLLQVDELWGNVTRIGIRSSTIRTFAGADVIVPNGDLTSNRVTNWTLSDLRRRVSLPVSVAYGTDAATVIELLKDVAASHEATLEHPEPYVLFTGFGDSSLDFEIRLWTESEDANTLVRSDIAVATQAALARAGIEVPFPQRDVHLAGVTVTPNAR